jgi:hypothetical protein
MHLPVCGISKSEFKIRESCFENMTNPKKGFSPLDTDLWKKIVLF